FVLSQDQTLHKGSSNLLFKTLAYDPKIAVACSLVVQFSKGNDKAWCRPKSQAAQDIVVMLPSCCEASCRWAVV
ncbi:hypothetical protein, partial [Paenibacillus cymbidii]|uniref:hypothetical protein n=1 Tax=Paenibacillus cymbidii TaxID=1639034 RepID=UPI001A9BBDCB